MHIIKSLNQSLLPRVFEAENKYFLAVTVLNFFSFEPGSGLIPEPALWAFAGQEMGKDAILDMCMPKHCGEVLVHGRCFAPNGKPAPANEVHLAIGSVKKSLYVFGDRFWRREGGLNTHITDPLPFVQMEMSWEKAFGGEGHEDNPDGKGLSPIKGRDGQEVLPLPNIEDPKQLIGSPYDKPEPAGITRIDLTRPQRMNKAGTYDEKWQKELFPGLARDMDPTFFNEAPEDQWIQGFFRGDEKFEVKGMHPEKTLVQGRLPGIRCRCFANHKVGDKETFKEIETSADTVWLFPHAEKGVIIYRGVLEVFDDEGMDVLHMLCAYERMGSEPRPFEHYRNAYLRRTVASSDDDPLMLIDESDLMPPDENAPMMTILKEALENREEGPQEKNMKRKAQKTLEENRQNMIDAGLDPDKYLPKELPATKKVTIDDIMNMDEMSKKAQKEAGEQMKEMADSMKDSLKSAGLDFDAFMEEARKKGVPRPVFDAEEVIKNVRMMGFDKPEVEEKIRKAEVVVQESYRTGAQYMPPGPIPADEVKAAMRQEVIEGHKQGRSFKGMDLLGIDLSNLDLKGIDLSEAFIEDANLAGANLSGANLTRCVFARSDLTKAKLSGCNLVWANLGACNLTEADLSGSDLSGAILTRANLSGTDFSGSKMQGAEFLEAKLPGVNFTKAFIGRAAFIDVDMSGARLVGADINGANFINVNLSQADLSGVGAAGVVFVNVNGEKAVFKGSDMSKACAVNECVFRKANFQGAVLNESGWMNTDLEEADFKGSFLEMANFRECNMQGSVLSRASAARVRFDKADLTGAKMVSMNMTEGSLRKARLIKADLSGSNLYGAEVFRSVVGDTRFERTNLEMTKLEKWKPE